MKRIIIMVMTVLLASTAWASTAERGNKEIDRRKADLNIASALNEEELEKNMEFPEPFSYTRLVNESGFMKYGITVFERSVYRNPGRRDYDRFAELVANDAGNALAKEVIYQDGRLVYALLQMPSVGKINRFIAFQSEGENISIVYMEGETTLDELKKTFAKK